MALGTQYVIEYISETVQALRGARDLERTNAFIARNIGQQYANMTNIIGKNIDSISNKTIRINGKDAIQTTEKIGIVGQDTNGKFQQLTGTFTSVNGKLSNVTGSLKDVTGQFAKTNVETVKGQKNFLSLAQNVGRLASRAILTIPLWMAFRTAMTSVFKSITDGFKAIIDQDKAFTRLRKTLQGTSADIKINLDKAKKAITAFSIESGKSIEDITNAVYEFSTVGFDIDSALSAGFDSVRLATVLFGDAKETSVAFARSIRAMATDITDAKRTQEELAQAMALTSELFETNAFKIDELSSGLQKFSGTAKSLGLSISETLVLMASLSSQGLNANRTGRILAMTFTKLQTRLDEIASLLGIKVNPELDTTFSLFMKVTKAIGELKGERGLDGVVKIAPQVAEAIKSIFGARSGEAVFDIVADIKNVSKSMEDFLAQKPDVTGFRNEFKNMEDDLNRQVEIYHNLNREIGHAFITGLVDAENYTDALQSINTTWTEIYDNAEKYGKAVQNIFKFTPISIGLTYASAKQKQKEIQELRTSIKDRLNSVFPTLTLPLDSMKITGGLDAQALQQAINDIIAVQTTGLDVDISQEDLMKGLINARQQLVDLSNKNLKTSIKEGKTLAEVNNVLLEKKDYLKLEDNVRKELLASGLDEITVEEKILELKKESNRFVEKDIYLQQELINHLEKVRDIDLQRTKERGIIDNQLQLLQLQGATNIELLKAERIYENAYGQKQSQLEQLKFEIELQKEITKEKSAQNSVSSETVNLYKIAQKYGTKTAFDVSQFLKGNTSLPFTNEGKLTSRGVGNEYKLKKALDEFFSSVVEARETMQYFTEGKGRFIPTKETGLRDIIPTQNLPTPEEMRLQQKLPILPEIKLPNISTNIDTIKFELKQVLSDNKLAEKILDELANALKSDTRIIESVKEIVEEY